MRCVKLEIYSRGICTIKGKRITGSICIFAGNPFAGISNPETWDFTTVDSTGPVVTGAFSPADDSTDISTNVSLVVNFDEVPKGIEVNITDGADDAEEVIKPTSSQFGRMDLVSSDLELGRDGTYPQAIGLRYNLPVGNGATISEAYLQFSADQLGYYTYRNPTFQCVLRSRIEAQLADEWHFVKSASQSNELWISVHSMKRHEL